MKGSRYTQTGKLHTEAQIFSRGGSWHMTVTMTQDQSTWTSNPVMLDATTYDDACAESAIQITRLLAILGRKMPPSVRQRDERYVWQEGDVIPEWGNRPLSATEAADLNRRGVARKE